MTRLILFDGPYREHLLPLTYTRPVSELRTGILTIREKWEKILGIRASWLTLPYLESMYPCSTGSDNLLISASLLPDERLVDEIRALKTGESLYAGSTFLAGRTDVGKPDIFLQPGRKNGKDKKKYEHPVREIKYPWDLFVMNGEEIESDFRLLTKGRTSLPLPRGCRMLGDHPLFLEEGAVMEYCTVNTRSGPVYIGKNAVVSEGSMIRGPFALGDRSEVRMGARIYENTSAGPRCKLAGEIVSSVILGYSNKSHEGFLGHSVLGEWCNLGADTNTSNLKNNYASVKVWNYPSERFISTGLQMCGLIMGDHSKSGINTMFNTGTVVGVFANIFGDGFPRNFIPSFSWGGAAGFQVYNLEKALEVARIVMKRRDRELTGEEESVLRNVFSQTTRFRKF